MSAGSILDFRHVTKENDLSGQNPEGVIDSFNYDVFVNKHKLIKDLTVSCLYSRHTDGNKTWRSKTIPYGVVVSIRKATISKTGLGFEIGIVEDGFGIQHTLENAPGMGGYRLEMLHCMYRSIKKNQSFDIDSFIEEVERKRVVILADRMEQMVAEIPEWGSW